MWPYILLILSMTTSLAFALMRPYKRNLYNRFDSVFFSLLALAYFCIQRLVFTGKDLTLVKVPSVLTFILGILPLVYTIVFTFYWVIIKHKLMHKCLGLCICISEKYRDLILSYSELDYEVTPIATACNHVTSTLIGSVENSGQELDSSLPDRIVHPQV